MIGHATLPIVAINRNQITTDPAISGYNIQKSDGPRVTHFVGRGVYSRNGAHLEIRINCDNPPSKYPLEGEYLPAAENQINFPACRFLSWPKSSVLGGFPLIKSWGGGRNKPRN